MDSNELMIEQAETNTERLRAELKRIEAKKILKMKLTEEESSKWALYGSAGGRKW